MLKNLFISNIVSLMDDISEESKRKLHNVLSATLSGYKLELDGASPYEPGHSEEILNKFYKAKITAGRSEGTISQYKLVIDALLKFTGKDIALIGTDDIVEFLSDWREKHNCSAITMKTKQAYISSVMAWLKKHRYIQENPMDLVEAIKANPKEKRSFSEEEICKMRDACDTDRNLAILDFLNSSMVRVGELVKLNKDDIFFGDRECIVIGKGDKQRQVYFDGQSRVHLEEYLKNRDDNNKALFVSSKAPHQRMSVSGIRRMLKNVGARADVRDVYPHKFRRTGATRCLDKGVPIDIISTILGHASVRTTQIYAKTSKGGVKSGYNRVYN